MVRPVFPLLILVAGLLVFQASGAAIAGLSFLDANGDGRYDMQVDSPLPGWEVRLFSQDGVLVATNLTDQNGFFVFDELPSGGAYLVEEVRPRSWAGAGGAMRSVVLSSENMTLENIFHLPDDADLRVRIPTPYVVFSTKLRGGATGVGVPVLGADLGSGDSVPSMGPAAHVSWLNGQEVPFRLSYDPKTGEVVYTVGGRTVSWTVPEAVRTPIVHLALHAQADAPGTRVDLFDIRLSAEGRPQVILPDSELGGINATKGVSPRGHDVLYVDADGIYGLEIQNLSFVLSGRQRLTWDPLNPPISQSFGYTIDAGARTFPESEIRYAKLSGASASIGSVQVRSTKEIETPGPTATPKETDTPEVTKTPKETETPEPTATPKETGTPEVTKTLKETGTPEVTVIQGRSPTDTGSISGSKWHDLDGDHKWDNDEPTLAGWTIYLEQQESKGSDWLPVGSTTTGANGAYKFTGLAEGHYRVYEVVPSGWEQTYPTNNAGMHNLVISNGQPSWEDQDFGNLGEATATPTKTTTTAPPTETPIETATPTVTITEGQPPTETVTPTPEVTTPTGNGTIMVVKFNDLDGNGLRDEGEPGIADWLMTLYRDGSPLAVQATDPEGSTVFSDLDPAGGYLVTEETRDGWTPTTPALVRVNFTESPHVTVLIGNWLPPSETATETPLPTATPLGSISGSKWHDLDGDHKWDDGEPTLAGWTIYLEQQESKGSDWLPVGSTTTGANGAYTFTGLAEGHYRVYEVVPPGWEQTYPTNNAGMHNLVISNGQPSWEDQDFGNLGEATATPTKTTTTAPPTGTPVETATPTVTITEGQSPTETATPDPTTAEPTQTVTTTIPSETSTATPEATTPTVTITEGQPPTETATPTPDVTTPILTETPAQTDTLTVTMTTVTGSPTVTPVETATPIVTIPEGRPPTETVTSTPDETTAEPTETVMTTTPGGTGTPVETTPVPTVSEGQPPTEPVTPTVATTTVTSTPGIPSGTTTAAPTPTITEGQPSTETATPTPAGTTPGATSAVTMPATVVPTPTVTEGLPPTVATTAAPTTPDSQPTRTTIPTVRTPDPTATPTPWPTGTFVLPTPPIDMPTPGPDLCPPLETSTSDETPITGPGRITSPGFYRFVSSFEDVNETVWLDISASNITIDGNGFTLDGRDRTGTHGIRVLNGSTVDRVVIQNLTVTDFAYGISLYNATNTSIAFVNASSNTYDGIMTSGGADNLIACNVIHQDDDGINLTGTNRTVVINNTVTENFRGSGIHLAGGADSVSLFANRIGYNDEGIEIEETTNSEIAQNLVWHSRYSGLNLTAADNLSVFDNYFRNRENIRPPTGLFGATWNLSTAPGPNLLGGSSIGGNFWGDLNRTGFSETHRDNNRDGFVDAPYVLPGGAGIDWLPLASPAGGVDRVLIGPAGSWRDWLQTFFS